MQRETPSNQPQTAFARQAAITLGLTLAVVLFGAIVRITGSGAGCGQHWPTCEGEIVHLPRRVETAIELSHRLSSGLSALAVFWLAFVAHRTFGAAGGVRRAALTASAMMVVEALLGAALVLFKLVGMNASVGRALVMPLHLLSTSALLGALALCFWWSRPRAELAPPEPGPRPLAWTALAAVLLTSASGALTALGDTVYPVKALPVAERLVAEQGPAAHFLERLRVVHPLIAVLSVFVLFSLASRAREAKVSDGARLFALGVGGLACAQLALGALNVLLSAPGYMQVAHLLTASLVWIALVLLTSELYVPRASTPWLTAAVPAERETAR